MAAQTTKFWPPILLVCRRNPGFPPSASRDPGGHDRPRAKAALAHSDQLTCRAGAPKTRHQFEPFSAETRHSGRDSMGDVFVCDAVRTPIGRFGGSLAKVRADDLAAAPIKALMARHPKLDWAAGRRGLFRLRQPGRRGQPQRRADGAAAGGPAGIDSRPDAQSPLRLRARCGRRRRARDPRRRDRFCHCRRRRIDDAGAVRDGQGAGSVFALGRYLRHHHRLALHQSR